VALTDEYKIPRHRQALFLCAIMKKLFLSSVFICVRLLSFTQDGTIKMFEDAVRTLKPSQPIIYLDSVINFYGLLSNSAKRGKLEGYFDSTKVTLKLGRNEIRFLDNAFKRDSTFSWKPGLFDHSLMITHDSVNKWQPRFMPDQKDKKDNKYFCFSRIVYFRNNTMAVFRLTEMYGFSAGYDYLFFYKKEENQWKRYMRVNLGAW